MREHSYNEIIENLFVDNAPALCDEECFSLIVNCTNDIPECNTHHSWTKQTVVGYEVISYTLLCIFVRLHENLSNVASPHHKDGQVFR